MDRSWRLSVVYYFFFGDFLIRECIDWFCIVVSFVFFLISLVVERDVVYVVFFF